MCNFAKDNVFIIAYDIRYPLYFKIDSCYYTLDCKLNFSETSTIGKILRGRSRTARKGESRYLCKMAVRYGDGG